MQKMCEPEQWSRCTKYSSNLAAQDLQTKAKMAPKMHAPGWWRAAPFLWTMQDGMVGKFYLTGAYEVSNTVKMATR